MADSPRSILARLEELKQWQENQQRALLEKHLAQQKLLEREQQKMYEVLGFQHGAATEEQREQSYEDSGSESEYEETNLEVQLAAERVRQASVTDESTMFDPDTERPTVEQEQALQKTKNIPKKRFLKRGEGLRARFKVDPDKFKLDNLPKYKYANHNRERNDRKSRTKGETVPGKVGSKTATAAQKSSPAVNSRPESVGTNRKSSEKKPRNKSDQGIILDVNRVQDKKLKSTRPTGGSLPATHSDEVNKFDELLVAGVKTRKSKIQDDENLLPKPPAMPDVPWNLRLDPTVVPKVSKEQRELNFFELLEEKVVGRSFNSNSSSILRFIAANESTVNEETMDNDDTTMERLERGPLVRREEATAKGKLGPPPSRVALSDSDSDDDEDDDQAHVRFAEEERFQPQEEDTDLTDQETYHHMRGMTSSKMSTPNDKCVPKSQPSDQPREESESDEEQSTGCADEDATVDSPNGQSEDDDTAEPAVTGDDTLRNEILAKSELLKQKLTELEREINTYRRENADLIQAKHDHELERLKSQQDREKAEERMNDERIKMEVYFHDERMKIEAERKQALREAQKPNKKDREEIMRLTDELAELRKQQKERDSKHSASLARFRAREKTLEKELQEVRLELEVAKKDNRRLETENTRLKRQNNSRMLVEINRNIAKLAGGGGEPDTKPERGHSPEKPKKGTQVAKRVKSEQDVRVAHRTQAVRQVRAKVISHAPSRVNRATRGSSLPLREELCTSETDENEPEGHRALGGSCSEDDSSEDSDTDDGSGAEQMVGENSSSPPEPSAYFSKNPSVRKTLFNPVNGRDTAAPRLGLVRKENPPAKGDPLDRTPEAAEVIKSMKREIVNADGSRDIWYPNGNLKKISPDGLIMRMVYFNKDIKETNVTEGTTKYYYAETNTWHTTYLDGLEILEFPDGQTEHRFKDGSTEVHFPNGSIRTTNPNSADVAEEWKYPDGTTVIIRKNEDKEINLPNGQVEIHTQAHKRRIYPDGTVKFVYPDGSQESRYSNGRIRLKDKDGRLISDTGGGTPVGRVGT